LLNVGVIGCGTAGAAAALFLERLGHKVSIFERVAAPSAVGAGIMLQPTGQKVLAALGLEQKVLASAAPCESLRVETSSGRALLELSYREVSQHFTGYGVHRGVLFEALTEALGGTTASLNVGVSITRAERTPRGRILHDDTGRKHGPFDLVVVADGAKSQLRMQGGSVQSQEGYPWGALWFMAEDAAGAFDGQLYQVVEGTRFLCGLLPTGKDPEGTKRVSLFVSVRASHVDAVRAAGLNAFKASIVQSVPRAAPVVAQIQDMKDLLYSGYQDVVMRPWHARDMVYLGDAAHAMSPQLGQGANLALYDAYILNESLGATPHVATALSMYSRRRHAHLAYYQFITRALTPFFQSDHNALGLLRDWTFPLIKKIAPFRRAMTRGMCGISEGHPFGVLSNLRP
jgi:2-polyprenyl-6-methoxyphenol hydroxylase-like FAD-dependent oxidoreductase